MATTTILCSLTRPCAVLVVAGFPITTEITVSVPAGSDLVATFYGDVRSLGTVASTSCIATLQLEIDGNAVGAPLSSRLDSFAATPAMTSFPYAVNDLAAGPHQLGVTASLSPACGEATALLADLGFTTMVLRR